METINKLDLIARNFEFIANGTPDYVLFGNAFKIPSDFEINL